MMLTLLWTLLFVMDEHGPEIGTALEAKVEHTYTCATHTATYYEREPGDAWEVVEVRETPTGNDCAPGQPFAPDEEGM